MPEPTVGKIYTRSVDVDITTDQELREFSGIGVPFGQIIEHLFGRETFDPGSVDADGARLFYGHREPIGIITANQDTDNGHQITGRISDTTLGRDVWTLLRDGAITSLSIGFEPTEPPQYDDDGVLHWTKVRAHEFSLVGIPAYSDATVDPSTLRTQAPKENTMTDTITRADLDTINNTLDDLTRGLAIVQNATTPTNTAGHQWRSMGHFLKDLAAGNADAAEFHREYTGSTTADTVMKDSFVGEYIQLVNDHRRLLDDFTRSPLPADGLSIDYAQLKEDLTKVAKQAKEGDGLVKGKVVLDRANAPVETWGGWTELSFQQIEKATIKSLDITLRALGLRYAKVTNLAFRDAYLKVVADNTDAAKTTPTSVVDLGAALDASTAGQWLDGIVDAAIEMEERGFSLTRLHATADVFKALQNLKDGDHRLMTVYGTGVNQVGTMNVKGLRGDLAHVEVKLIPGRDKTGLAAFSDPVALEFLESPGAPAQLQDQNIVNLTKQFSVYGYGAILSPFPQAILPIKFGPAE